MGWKAEQNRRRRQRIEALIRKGFSNAELYGQGHSSSVIAAVRRELDIPDPGDLLTHEEVAAARVWGPRKNGSLLFFDLKEDLLKLGVNPNSDKEKIVTNPQKHTPGPWRWVKDSSGRYNLIGGDGGDGVLLARDVVIEYYYDSNPAGSPSADPTDSPNARLMVAAPDMLAALKGVANMIQSSLPPSIRAPVEAAIEKAEGNGAGPVSSYFPLMSKKAQV